LEQLDQALIDLDGTPDKSRLGANSIVAVSMAAARAFARANNRPLHVWMAEMLGAELRAPVPHFNVLNGGAHAGNDLDFQEFMIAPVGAPNVTTAVEWGSEIYHALASELRRRGLSTGLGDEGGFAPEIAHPEEALDLLVAAIASAGYTAGRHNDVAIAIDPAANGFYTDGRYTVAEAVYSSDELVDYYRSLLDAYPIWSLEDPLAEEDTDGWAVLCHELSSRAQIVGDDLLVTAPDRIRAAADANMVTAALIKPNQIGTVTETFSALTAARDCELGAMISHRSGETVDTFVADLAVASGVGQLKSGAPARGERVAKYNRLLEIEHTAWKLPYGIPEPARADASS
jgi:enolase